MVWWLGIHLFLCATVINPSNVTNLSCDSLGRNDARQLCQSQITQLSDSVRALRGICLMMWLLKRASGPKKKFVLHNNQIKPKVWNVPNFLGRTLALGWNLQGCVFAVRSCFIVALITQESCYEGRKPNVFVFVWIYLTLTVAASSGVLSFLLKTISDHRPQRPITKKVFTVALLGHHGAFSCCRRI